MSSTASSRKIATNLSSTVLELLLQCPQCLASLGRISEDDFPPEFLLSCTNCFFQLCNEDGIWYGLTPARRAHFGQFIHEYQIVRAAEGRGSDSSEYYLALPYQDLSGRNQSRWEIRGRTFRFLEQRILPGLVGLHAKGLRILDLGAGNGWMSYRLAIRGHRPVAVDLIAAGQDGLAAARHYKPKLPGLFPRFQAELDRLPFAGDQFDLAIFNASFHYSENYGETLGEAIRCLRPGGTVIIADTAWYRREETGRRMVAERQKTFVDRYHFASNSLASQEYLTDQRLADLESQFGISWQVHTPFYGAKWAMRPWVAKLKGRREPSRFRIYVAEVTK